MPYKRIAAELGVSPSSVFHWTSDIQLTPEQVEENLRGRHGPHGPELAARRAAAWSAICRDRRRRYQQEGRAKARLGSDPLHLAGCMLYWAEGAKNRNCFQLANSELHMMRLIKRFVTESFEIGPDRLTVTLNVYLGNGLEISEIEKYWLDGLQVPSTCLRKHMIDHFPTSSSGLRPKRLPYGVCRVRVLKSTPIVQHVFGAIQEYGGFDEPRWLG